MALVSGWGRPSDSSSGISEVLRYVDDRRVLSQEECENYWGNLNDGVVCIDTTDGGGSCNGDSGGPLSIPGAQYEQIGIVSFGSTLGCESGAPAGFTEVTMYRDWISSVTGIKV
jgi:secreted trypsin-like serine protease